MAATASRVDLDLDVDGEDIRFGSSSRVGSTRSLREGDGEGEEVVAKSSKCSSADVQFDEVVGELEDMLMDPYFIELQETFMAENCDVFTDDEENKHVYTDLFHSYVKLIETFIEKRLKARLSWFSMSTFLMMMKSQKEALDGDVFDVLSSLAEFTAFKELMLSYKNERQGTSMDLSGLLAVHGAGK
ncbi:the ARF-like 2 binding protein BART-domain-containing protein [Fimicolochytrium jonesii]|uniref:the ARF-like 2 binding protein BART-domain-containing protein n=1 Tax=Fimicolochytrium jonesii TaxID=1396493 RepID=UPI0022FED9F1|nr:the ARF-like 2 binding protein BART-domain-containing protein [Fimicolochytrium jonesii]KAI8827024.1 the ARF-like 2 binding protein BART-domain-containing protein [Fimicolochytrium jonesii]